MSIWFQKTNYSAEMKSNINQPKEEEEFTEEEECEEKISM